MRSHFVTFLIALAGLILFNGCTSTSSSTQSNPNVQVNEAQSQTVTSIEIIRINNCGGKGNSEQVTERSFAVNIEGGLEVQGGVEYLQGTVSGKYGQYRNYSKSLKVVAPPGTNMEFEIKWTELEWTGTLTASGQSGKYSVHAPIEVEQVSSQDKGSCNTTIPPSSEQPTAIIQPSQDGMNCSFINELVTKADVIKKLYEGQSLAGVQARLLYGIDVPIGWIVQYDGKDYYGPIHF